MNKCFIIVNGDDLSDECRQYLVKSVSSEQRELSIVILC